MTRIRRHRYELPIYLPEQPELEFNIMLNPLRYVLLTLLVALASMGPCQAADIERGRVLHSENCIQCHAAMYGGDGTTIYVREDRRIDSLVALTKQVRRCKNSLGLPWPEDQIEDLIIYLNSTFYHFEK